MKSPFKSLETKLIHAGEPEPRILGAVAMPIFQSATFQYAGETSYHDLKYIRLNNTPNHLALHQKLAAVENAEAALVTASGMAAISTSLLTVLKAGDHLLIQSSLYGGTHDLVTRDFPAFGLSYDFIEAERPETWKALLKPNTKAIYVEAMTNPLLQVADLEAIVQFARTNGLVSLIDSTFASPVNFRALEWGFDLSLHSGTKYLNGHSDIVCGVVLGQAALIQKITHRLNHLGGTLDPHAAYLLHRGLKTMALRVRYQNESALKIARFLAEHPAVARVNYAGLESHPGHEPRAATVRRLWRCLKFRAARRCGSSRQIPEGGALGDHCDQPRGCGHPGHSPCHHDTRRTLARRTAQSGHCRWLDPAVHRHRSNGRPHRRL